MRKDYIAYFSEKRSKSLTENKCILALHSDARGTGRRTRQRSGGFLLISGSLIDFDLIKIDAVQNASGRMQPSQSDLDLFVDDPVVLDLRFPAHAADEVPGLHLEIFPPVYFWVPDSGIQTVIHPCPRLAQA